MMEIIGAVTNAMAAAMSIIDARLLANYVIIMMLKTIIVAMVQR